MCQILIVEDEKNTRLLMSTVLARYGYDPVAVCDGREALDLLKKQHVDLIVLDVMMPRMDGYELTSALRKSGSTVPILMVTAKETLEDKKRGFLTGADDYMVKPVNEEEMALRISALLRRSRIAGERRMTVGKTTLLCDSDTVVTPDATYQLPQKEFQLLFRLLTYPNKIFTRRQLMDAIWETTSESEERTVDVHISRLRERFRDNPDFRIVTARGLGYKAVLQC